MYVVCVLKRNQPGLSFAQAANFCKPLKFLNFKFINLVPAFSWFAAVNIAVQDLFKSMNVADDFPRRIEARLTSTLLC